MMLPCKAPLLPVVHPRPRIAAVFAGSMSEPWITPQCEKVVQVVSGYLLPEGAWNAMRRFDPESRLRGHPQLACEVDWIRACNIPITIPNAAPKRSFTSYNLEILIPPVFPHDVRLGSCDRGRPCQLQLSTTIATLKVCPLCYCVTIWSSAPRGAPLCAKPKDGKSSMMLHLFASTCSLQSHHSSLAARSGCHLTITRAKDSRCMTARRLVKAVQMVFVDWLLTTVKCTSDCPRVVDEVLCRHDDRRRRATKICAECLPFKFVSTHHIFTYLQTAHINRLSCETTVMCADVHDVNHGNLTVPVHLLPRLHWYAVAGRP